MPKYHKIQRAVVLALFPIASVASYFKPHLIPIAGLALIGVIAYDIVCYLKEKNAPKDFTNQIKELKDELTVTSQHVREMKDDVSVAKLANSFRRG